MIFGIGTDLVHIPRIQAMLDRHGVKAAQKILHPDELVAFEQSSQQTAFLAKRFAAKEAVAKALGTGFRDGLSLSHIAVSNDALGKPQLSFYHQCQQLIERFNIGRSHLSLSDEKEYVIAYVILEQSS